MLTIQLNPNISRITSSTSILLSEVGHPIQGSGQTAYRIGFHGQKPGVYLITYGKISNILIQENYETACRNYSTYGYLSKAQFIDQCLDNLTSSYFGAVFYGTVQAHNTSNDHLKNGYYQYYGEYLTPDISEQNRLRKFFKFCRQHCYQIADKPDCEESIYSPIGYRNLIVGEEIYIIVLRAPTVPFEINEYFPEYTLLDLIIYLASSLNFWFGLSLVSISERFLSCYCGLFEKPVKRRKSPTIRDESKLSTIRNDQLNPVMEAFTSKVVNKRAKVSRIKIIDKQLPTVYW